MTNIASTFRQEITRLARRELRSHMQGLRKASAQFRRDVAELKRHAAALKSQVARLERRIGKSAAPPITEAGPAIIRFTAKGVVARRRSLGMSAADFGKLVGVTGHTVYKWEHGNARPRRAQLSALAFIRRLTKTEALARLAQMREKTPKRRKLKRQRMQVNGLRVDVRRAPIEMQRLAFERGLIPFVPAEQGEKPE